jgi:20S proteasome alpha/beta subunit
MLRIEDYMSTITTPANQMRPPIRKPYTPEKPKGAKAMTIAAAIPYREGVLVCADTQISYPNGLMYSDLKVLPFPVEGIRAVFAYSDQVNLAHEIKELLTVHLASVSQDSKDISSAEFLGTVRSVVNDYGRLYVEQPLNFLLAIYPTKDRPSVVLFDGKAVTLLHHQVVVIGCGNDTLTRFLIDKLYAIDMEENHAIVFGAYLIRKATQYIQGCGEPIDMALVKKDAVEIVPREKIKAAIQAAECEESSLHQVLVKKPLEIF